MDFTTGIDRALEFHLPASSFSRLSSIALMMSVSALLAMAYKFVLPWAIRCDHQL